MSAILVPVLYGVTGICAFAALQHGQIAARRPVERVHLAFACLSLVAALHVLAKAAAYQAQSVDELVELRRLEMSGSAVFFAILPWFVAEYCKSPNRWLPLGFSAFFAAALAANQVLPYGLGFMQRPDLEYLVLPWGERVAELRAHPMSPWLSASWVGVLAVFATSFHACRRQYLMEARHSAVTLGLGLGLCLSFILFNQVVNLGLVRAPHTAELGLVALVVVMSRELIHERRTTRLRMQAILDHVPAAVSLKGLDGRYLLVNRIHEERFRVAEHAVIGRTDGELFASHAADVARSQDRRVLQSRQPWQFEEAAEQDGELRHYVSLAFPLIDPDGGQYAVCRVSTDVTEARLADQEMQSLRRQVWHADRVERTAALAASLAHELSQPLTAILSNAQAALRFLSQKDPDLGEVRDILQDIARDDKRASGVINGLRAMLRRQETPRERVDLSGAVEEVIDLMHSDFLGHGIEVAHSLGAGCIAMTDKAQMQQVMLNLMMNASEAMTHLPEGERRLQVSVSRDDDLVRVAVRDCGRGIAGDQIERVFDRFYTTKAQGLGMGLAVCRSILEAHGGSIGVAPNEGQGVTFVFSLPLEADSRAALARAAA